MQQAYMIMCNTNTSGQNNLNKAVDGCQCQGLLTITNLITLNLMQMHLAFYCVETQYSLLKKKLLIHLQLIGLKKNAVDVEIIREELAALQVLVDAMLRDELQEPGLGLRVRAFGDPVKQLHLDPVLDSEGLEGVLELEARAVRVHAVLELEHVKVVDLSHRLLHILRESVLAAVEDDFLGWIQRAGRELLV